MSKLFEALKGANPIGQVTELTKEIGNTGDKLTTSDDERYDGIARLEQERTARHEKDMESDSWWSKFVRPGSYLETLNVVLIITLVCFYHIVTGDMIQSRLELLERVFLRLVGLIEMILIVQVGFYFGSRGLEKLSKIMGGLPEMPGTKKGFFKRLLNK